ncbi:MAG: 30S ribosomal protein S27ae [Candidatus Pacearchaeota archaeon]|nr:30S ribosomal protein S27ae [Candidatus Pacearchaeota archaeon]
MAKLPKTTGPGKKKRKPKKSSERYKKYKISGIKAERTAKFCPRCGPGIFLAESKDRLFCGRCHYTEFK